MLTYRLFKKRFNRFKVKTEPINRVKEKHLKAVLHYWAGHRLGPVARENLKRAIRRRLVNEHGIVRMSYDHYTRVRPKPRVRHKLRPRHHWDGKQFIGVYQ